MFQNKRIRKGGQKRDKKKQQRSHKFGQHHLCIGYRRGEQCLKRAARFLVREGAHSDHWCNQQEHQPKELRLWKLLCERQVIRQPIELMQHHQQATAKNQLDARHDHIAAHG